MSTLTVLRKIVSTDRVTFPPKEITHSDVHLIQSDEMPVSQHLTIARLDGTRLAEGSVSKFTLGYPLAPFHIKFRVMVAYAHSKGITRYRREDWYVTFPSLPEVKA